MEPTGEMLLEGMQKARRAVSAILGIWKDETEDILQTACAKAIRGADSFDGKAKFTSWFTRIAINEALMLRRKRLRHGGEHLSLTDMLSLDEVSANEGGASCYIENTLMSKAITSPKPNPEQIFLKKEANQDLVDCIFLLSPSNRKEALLWAVGEASDADPNTRKARRWRARRELKVMLSI